MSTHDTDYPTADMVEELRTWAKNWSEEDCSTNACSLSVALMPEVFERTARRLEELAAERELADKLAKYARHANGCTAATRAGNARPPWHPCSCGYTEVAAALWDARS